MKKYFKVLSVLLISILVFTGCGKKSETGKEPVKENELNQVIKNTFDGKNFSYTLTIKGSEDGLDNIIEIYQSLKGDLYIKDNIESMYFTADEKITYLNEKGEKKSEKEFSEEGYEVYKDGEYYYYSKSSSDNKWTYMTSKTSELSDFSSDLIIKNIKSSKEVTSDKSGYTKYEIVFNDEFIKDILDSNGDSISSSNIYVKDDKIAIIEINAELKDKDIKANYIYEISNVGEVKEIKVPEEVKKNATYNDINKQE